MSSSSSQNNTFAIARQATIDLGMAISRGQLELAKHLVSLGANVEDSGAMSEACMKCDLDCIKYLVSTGTMVSDQDIFEATTLYEDVPVSSRSEVLRYFVETLGRERVEGAAKK